MKNIEITCPSCGKTKFGTSNKEERFEYGREDDAVELSVNVPVHICEGCGFQFTSGDAEDIRHEAVCRHLERMPPSRIRELRRAHGLSRAEFAVITGIGSASLARWETGQLIQGAAHDSLLYLLCNKANLERLAARTADSSYTITDQDSDMLKMESAFVHISAEDHDVIQREEHFSLHLH